MFADARELRGLPSNRLTPKKPAHPFKGRVIALDTEGTANSAITATAKWDENGRTYSLRFTDPEMFAQFLIDQFSSRIPIIAGFHNLEWDLQLLIMWLDGVCGIRYERHSARKNGSALVATFDYEGRQPGHSKIVFRDTYALYSMSLARLGDVVGIPKLRTPKQLIPKVVSPFSGEMMENPCYEDGTDAVCDHGLSECMQCYDLRDVDILYAAMRLYIAECDRAHIKPQFTRSATAMADWRTNYLPATLAQYSERENMRAQLARYGGRTQMLVTGQVDTPNGKHIRQYDAHSQYPSVMLRGGFPDAGNHVVLHHPPVRRLHELTGFAFADVTVPHMRIGPLIYRHPQTGRISYPTAKRLQAAWTTGELEYLISCGGTVNSIIRMEGTPTASTLDPFSRFITDKYSERARLKAEGNPLQESVKLTMNGLSGKFGMNWLDKRIEFIRGVDVDTSALLGGDMPLPVLRDDQDPVRYPDYIMTIWSAIIMARGRISLHRFGMALHNAGATLLCCDTDSWAAVIPDGFEDTHSHLFGDELGEYGAEGPEYRAFYGSAPKEYALYDVLDAVCDDPAHADYPPHNSPVKARAKGITARNNCLLDCYLRYGSLWYERPNKMRTVVNGHGAAGVFAPVHKKRHQRPPDDTPVIYEDFTAEVNRRVQEAEAKTLQAQKESLHTDDGVQALPF